MDKEILRLVIIGTGVLVMVGMIFWTFFRKGGFGRNRRFFDKKNSLHHVDPSLVLHHENDDFDIVPLRGGSFEELDEPDNQFIPSSDEAELANHIHVHQPKNNKFDEVPTLIQFSLVAKEDEGFNGIDLKEAFNQVGLEYGSMKIFERVDDNRMVDFSVACMVEPGTFPDKNLETFYCPGIVFFMQPKELDDPASVFDDFILTIDFLAKRLGGVKWDHKREPLSEETISSLRAVLKS